MQPGSRTAYPLSFKLSSVGRAITLTAPDTSPIAPAAGEPLARFEESHICIKGIILLELWLNTIKPGEFVLTRVDQEPMSRQAIHIDPINNLQLSFVDISVVVSSSLAKSRIDDQVSKFPEIHRDDQSIRHHIDPHTFVV